MFKNLKIGKKLALAFGVSKIFTTSYHPPGLRYGVTPTEGGAYAALSYNF